MILLMILIGFEASKGFPRRSLEVSWRSQVVLEPAPSGQVVLGGLLEVPGGPRNLDFPFQSRAKIKVCSFLANVI